MPKAKTAPKRIMNTEPATKAQPEPLEGAGASSTPAPSAPQLGRRPCTISRDGKKAVWIMPLSAGGFFGGG